MLIMKETHETYKLNILFFLSHHHHLSPSLSHNKQHHFYFSLCYATRIIFVHLNGRVDFLLLLLDLEIVTVDVFLAGLVVGIVDAVRWRALLVCAAFTPRVVYDAGAICKTNKS